MFDSDLCLVIGIVLVWLGIPAVVSAYANQRRPLFGGLILLVAAALMIFAGQTKEGGYPLTEIPEVFFQVVSRFL